MTRIDTVQIARQSGQIGELHTPGPWRVEEQRGPDGEICFLSINAGEHEFISSTWAGPHIANARLIAAAPDLLAMLKASYAEIRAWRDGLNHRNMNKSKVGAVYVPEWEIKAAIAKAEC